MLIENRGQERASNQYLLVTQLKNYSFLQATQHFYRFHKSYLRKKLIIVFEFIFIYKMKNSDQYKIQRWPPFMDSCKGPKQ